MRAPRPISTNLLGLVRHVAHVELGCFGEVFGRPVEAARRWSADDAEANWDMWATAEESREGIVDLYRGAWAHADVTIAGLPLDAAGHVPWWRETRRSVTLHEILVHVIAEIRRHAGDADVVRELIDGAAGLRAGTGNLPPGEAAWWKCYRDELERVARDAQEG